MDSRERLLTLTNELLQLFENSNIRKSFQFEYIKVVFCLSLIKMELALLEDISEDTRAVFTSIAGWSYHHHRGIRPEIHSTILSIDDLLRSGKYNTIIENSPIKDHRQKKEWIDFFNKKINDLIMESNGLQDSFFTR